MVGISFLLSFHGAWDPLCLVLAKVWLFAPHQSPTQRKPPYETSDSPRTAYAASRKLSMAHTWLE